MKTIKAYNEELSGYVEIGQPAFVELALLIKDLEEEIQTLRANRKADEETIAELARAICSVWITSDSAMADIPQTMWCAFCATRLGVKGRRMQHDSGCIVPKAQKILERK